VDRIPWKNLTDGQCNCAPFVFANCASAQNSTLLRDTRFCWNITNRTQSVFRKKFNGWRSVYSALKDQKYL